jgi:hypothetical protein
MTPDIQIIQYNLISKLGCCQEWWFMPVILALKSLRQEDCKFKASLGYIARPCLRKPTNQPTSQPTNQPTKETSEKTQVVNIHNSIYNLNSSFPHNQIHRFWGLRCGCLWGGLYSAPYLLKLFEEIFKYAQNERK